MQDSMQEFIAQANIRRFEAQLEAATDDSQKALIIGLLEAERRHLREILESNVEETS
jgi:rubrerythrin